MKVFHLSVAQGPVATATVGLQPRYQSSCCGLGCSNNQGEGTKKKCPESRFMRPTSGSSRTTNHCKLTRSGTSGHFPKRVKMRHRKSDVFFLSVPLGKSLVTGSIVSHSYVLCF